MPSHQPTHHGYAVNVKDQWLYAYDYAVLTDREADAVYEPIREDFWRMAADIARDHGFRDVYSEGRMGGWAVPHPQPDYDMDERHEAAWLEDRFRPFEADILALMAECQSKAQDALHEAARLATAEPAERAYWEARDTITTEA